MVFFLELYSFQVHQKKTGSKMTHKTHKTKMRRGILWNFGMPLKTSRGEIYTQTLLPLGASERKGRRAMNGAGGS